MTKKNILIISPFFFPEPISTGKYNTDLALALANEGHDVTFLCYHPFYPEWKVKKTKENLSNINIIRGGKHISYSQKTFLRRIILELSFAFFVLRKLKKHQKNKDVIIPIFPPSFAFYISLKFINKKIRKVGVVHDLQEIYSAEKKGFFNKIIKKLIHNVEKVCFKKCDKLIFLSHEMKQEAQKIYKLNNNKLRVQYPFVNINPTKTKRLKDIFDKDKINIVYSGALGDKQNPKKLYNFFNEASIKDVKKVFYIFSEGAIFKKLKKQNKNNNIKFYNLVKKDNLEELYNLSTVQIVPQKENTSKGSLPSKLPNLLASRCKILVITDANSEIESIFTSNNLNEICTSWNLNYLIDSLNNLLKKDIDFSHQQKVAKELFSLKSMISEILI